MNKHELVAEMDAVRKMCVSLMESANKLSNGDNEQKKMALEIAEGVEKITAQQLKMLAVLKEMD